jgi:hypothetical protein
MYSLALCYRCSGEGGNNFLTIVLVYFYAAVLSLKGHRVLGLSVIRLASLSRTAFHLVAIRRLRQKRASACRENHIR